MKKTILTIFSLWSLFAFSQVGSKQITQDPSSYSSLNSSESYYIVGRHF